MMSSPGSLRVCSRCVLPEAFPGITFSEDGVCNYCRSPASEENGAFGREYENQFLQIIDSIKSKNRYDCLLAFSGGKDSTYTLYLLKEKYGLNVLTYTFDNGFISEGARKNIKNITERLNVDNIVFSPRIDLLKKLFASAALNDQIYSRAAIMRASAICTTCINFIRYNSLKLAVEKRIPMLVFGWAPGQIERRGIILKPLPSFLAKSQEVFINANKTHLEGFQENYFLEAREFEENAPAIPYLINPLLFNEYRMEKVRALIEDLGWENPENTDLNSTNCLLNAFGNYVHLKKYGYNPYVQEISGLIRSGVITRDEGLARLEGSLDQKVIDECKRKLGLEHIV
ncbi:MAG: 7-cyano-7-deazaguanine synthase [Peptococcaceae bacterium]|jgi:tRNA(Ile)-lysidine synthase TilS/MesJ|nr:7-cyano-7-deazaguanine synthase [Peptococcaceae bacterium]MDH7525024.1 7-cyano-7-deazaguanine synthase [Peptococcaceae bacterium]